MDWIINPLIEIFKDPFVKYIGRPIKRHITYPFTYSSKVQSVVKVAEELKGETTRLQDSVDAAIRNNGEIYPDVENWLKDSAAVAEEVRVVVEDKEAAAKQGCFLGFCPRYKVSKASVKMLKVINELQQKKPPLETICRPARPQQHLEPLVIKPEAFESRLSVLNQVMDALRDSRNDSKLHRIGVYGMGGVGKSTLAKEIQTLAAKEKLFEDVVFVAVSQTPEIARIQRNLADALGLTLDQEEISVRANQLYERMKGKKILVILDDIWEKFDLNNIGISAWDDFKDCKVVVTSRKRDVLSNKMGTEREFMLRELENEESFCLFASTVTHAMEETFNDIAKNIVKKCGGLPLLILLIASELKDCKDERMWKAKQQQVSTFNDADIEKNVHSVIRRSYDELGDEIKSFFLLCALCGQSNVRIQSLERYCLGLGFLESRQTVDDVRNELVCWIQQLQNRCLLLPGDMDGYVKMHDIVRDTALFIACDEKHAFTSRSGVQLRALPEQNHRRISLPYSDLQKIIESDSQLPLFNCPEAELFLLLTEDLSLRIPDLFFQEIRKLRVLEFTGMGFGSLPSSIDLLKSLQTLCLHNCHLKEVAIIGELRQLEVLSFVDSFIVSLPNQIEQLTRLKILDLSNCSKLALVPANVLSKLQMLEELYMGNSFDQWEAMDVENRTKASLGELGDLKFLTTLELQVPFGQLVSELRLSSLDRYKIWIGDVWDWAGKYETSRTMKLMLRTHIKKIYRQVEKLLRNCEDLYLNQAGGIDVLFDTGFPQLKHLHVQNNTLIQHIINTGKVDSTRAFPVLESLVVDNLINLEKICHGQQAACYFKELRVLKVMNCEKLTFLLSVSMARCLFQLEEIEVISCAEIQAIVVGETDEDGAIEFKRLHSLNLRELPNLRSFFSREEPVESQVTQSSEIVMEGQLDNPTLLCEKVSLPSLINLIIAECHSFKSLFTISFAKSLYRLKKLEICECKYVEEMIAVGEVLEEGSKHNICFPQLEVMDFFKLEKLIRFCNGISIEFRSLKKLSIYKCRALRTFISSHPISGSIVSGGAKADSETNQDFLFNEMVAFPLERMELSWTGNFKRIWHNQLDPASFTKLKHLRIFKVDYLQTLFSSNVLEMFRRLESLRLFSCKSLQYVFDLEEITSTKRNNVVAAFELRELYVEGCDSLEQIWNDPQEVLNFQNLQSVRVGHCRDLKNVFPTSTARNGLLQLQELDISHCEKMEEIIGKTESDTSEESPCFKFPQLTSLCLEFLTQLTSFYPGKHSSEWPKLKKLKVRGCYKAIKFGSALGGEYLNQPLLFTENVNACLEELTLEGEDLTLMHQRDDQLPVERFSRLKTLTLYYLDRDQTLLSAFLGKLYCLENLIVCEGYVERLFSLQELPRECEYVNSLQQLKNLKLKQVHNLEHIWEEESQLTQYLQSLRISRCESLIYISPSSSSFKNLLTLHVDQCDKLAYLVTASTAKTMVQLTKLKIVRCRMMKEIVSNDGDQTEITFDKLKTLILSDLRKLTSFCSGNHSFNFPSLEKVLVRDNEKLGTFSGGSLCAPKLRGVIMQYRIEWAGNLNDTISRHLRKKPGVCFTLDEHYNGELHGRGFRNVKELTLKKYGHSQSALSPDQVLYMRQLVVLKVENCDSVQVAFDLEGLSVDEGHVGLLDKLEKLSLINLPVLSHVWSKNPLQILDLRRLEKVSIEKCNNLKHAFTWSMGFCLVQLEVITIKECLMMEAVIQDTTKANYDISFPSLKQVYLECLPKLSCFYSGRGALKCSLLEEISIEDCPNLGRNINDDDMKDPQIPQFFSFKVELPPSEKLKLDNKSAIVTMQPELFPNVRSIELKFIQNRSWVLLLGRLTMFSHLTSLEVRESHGLVNLMTSLVAKSMAPRLVSLNVRICNMLTQIVSGEQDDGLSDQEIVFSKLEELKLDNLHSLASFCSSSSCSFKFPSLESMFVDGCPKLRNFCSGDVDTPKLNSVKELYGGRGSRWNGNLKTTIEQLYIEMGGFQVLKEWKVSLFPRLQETWHDKVYHYRFFNLERLVLDNCAVLLSSAERTRFLLWQRLEEMVLEKCSSLEQVFDLEGMTSRKINLGLTKLQLIALPRLRYICNKDPQDILDCKNLTSVHVIDCSNLIRIFTLSMALNLVNLKFLEVKRCDLVKEIITKEVAEEIDDDKSIFPCLHSISLECLGSLSRFCSDRNIVVKLPSLKKIGVVHCPKMGTFTSKFSGEQQSSMVLETKGCEEGSDVYVATLFDGKVVIPCVEELKVEWITMKKMWTDKFQSAFLCKLQTIELTSLTDEKALLSSDFIRAVPILEKLVLRDSDFEEIVLEEVMTESLAKLRALKLFNLPNLKNLIEQNSRLSSVFQQLETLEVEECSRLKVLVPSGACFKNLTTLEVSKCHGLTNLMTSSTASSLVQLKRMVVKECEMIQEIVMTEANGVKDEIHFEQLRYLELHGLPHLSCFCSNNCDFYFSSLEEVIIRECLTMEIFARGVVSTPKLSRVQSRGYEYEILGKLSLVQSRGYEYEIFIQRKYWEWEWEGSLNNTIQTLFRESIAEETS